MNNDMGMDTLQEMKEKEDFFEVSALLHLHLGKNLPWIFGSINTFSVGKLLTKFSRQIEYT